MFLRRLILLMACASCTPYKNLDGDYYLGPIDPAPFPPAYQGAGYDPSVQAGTIAPAPATTTGSAPLAWYSFPVAAGADPLTLHAIQSGAIVADVPSLFVFDGDEAHDSARCMPPSPTYVFNQRTDFVRFDRQANVFREHRASADPPALPSDAGYAPIYAELPVTSGGEPCQTIHSAEGLLASKQVAPAAAPDGKYLAAAIVDPSAIVLLPDGTLDARDLGPQRFAFFDHYLVAYVDGGFVPTTPQTIPGTMGAPDITADVATPATLFAPNAFPTPMGPGACNPAAPVAAAAPCVGQGFDLIVGTDGMSGARGAPGYSPICHVRTFTPADPTAPPVDPAAVDPASLDPDAGAFVYCLQVAP